MPTPAPTSRPWVLFLAALVIGLEALAAVVFAVVAVTQINAQRVVVGAGVALLMLGYGLLLAAVARGVARGRRWSRGPAVATQVLQGLLGTSFGSGPTWAVGLALGLTALVTVVCLLLPAATAVFTQEQPSSED